jgi:hypothetical protein
MQNYLKSTLKKWLFTSRQVLKLTSPLKTCHLAENNIIKALQSPVASAEADSCLRLNIRLFKVSLNFGIRFEILFYNLKFLFKKIFYRYKKMKFNYGVLLHLKKKMQK